MSTPGAIAITGIGVASPAGLSAQAFWQALTVPQDLRGRWGKRALKHYPVDNVVAMPEPMWQTLAAGAPAPGSRAGWLAEFAVRQAFEDARLPAPAEGGLRTGCVLATTTAGVEGFEDVLLGAATVPREAMDGSTPAHRQAWTGPVSMLSTACSSGLMAPVLAGDMLLTGEADAMLAGGLDVLLEYTICGFNGLRLASPEACKPFAAGRRGVVLSEGVVVFCLEPLAAARARGAPVKAVIRGAGVSCDAQHVTAPDAAGVARAMRQALQAAGVPHGDIGAVFAHGTGTQANDNTELAALRDVFGDTLPPVTAIKSAMGHPQAAAGAFSLLAAVMALQHRHVPPIAWLDEPDPALGPVPFARGAGAPLQSPHVMVDAFGFGGNNCVVVVSDPAALEQLP